MYICGKRYKVSNVQKILVIIPLILENSHPDIADNPAIPSEL